MPLELLKSPGRLYLDDDAGNTIAEITWEETGPGPDGRPLCCIDHTYVDDSLRGQGIAGQLVQAAVDEIRAAGAVPEATCSYAVVWLEKHPEALR